jgi:hypothetical protein
MSERVVTDDCLGDPQEARKIAAIQDFQLADRHPAARHHSYDAHTRCSCLVRKRLARRMFAGRASLATDAIGADDRDSRLRDRPEDVTERARLSPHL